MDILVTGGAGRLGATIAVEMASGGHKITALGRSDLDISNREHVRTVVRRLRPDVIINCSAYNAVDDAEREAAAAFAINAEGPANLAVAAGDVSAILVHFSSDFVFDGDAVAPYAEEAPTNPLSVYGASKLAGEVEAARAERHYIVRLESNFGGLASECRTATIDKMIDSIVHFRPVRAFADRTVSPSYMPDVARATRAVIERSVPFGVYHGVNSGCATWYGVAMTIAHQLGVSAEITPTSCASVRSAAMRPRFCALSNQKLLSLGIEMPTWQSALARHLASRGVFVGATAPTHAWQIHS